MGLNRFSLALLPGLLLAVLLVWAITAGSR